MKKKSNERSLLDNRNIRVLVSVLIAVVIWMIVTLYLDPNKNQSFTGVPVNFTYDSATYTALGLDIVNEPKANVTVTLSGNGSEIGGLNKSDLVVYPDYSAVRGAGTMELPLKVRFTNSQLSGSVKATTDARVTVVFDTIEEKDFDVAVDMEVSGISIAEGYVLHGTTASPAKVTVRGPQSELEKIERLVAAVEYSPDLQNLSESKLATVELEPRDANNQPVELQYSTMDNTMVDVNIGVYQTKELPLKVNFINVPAGFDVNTLRYTLSQDTMTVTGRPSVIAGLTELAVSDFDLANSFALDKVYQLNVELPRDVESRDNLTSVTLSFNTEGLTTKTVNVNNLRIINQPANMQIKATASRISNVTLVGPKEALEKLSATAVSAIIDAGSVQITEGTESLAVQIRVPSSTSIFAVGSYSVECTIQASGAGG